jgi:hypothetical protein
MPAARLLILLCAGVALLLGCKGAQSGGGGDLDRDPIALLPGLPLFVARVDARAAYADSAIGASIGELSDELLPLGAGEGLAPSHDVDSIVLAGYSVSEPDVVAVVSGRFDTAALSAAVRTKTGTPIVAGTAGGFATRTFGRVSFAPITSHTVVAGTGEALPRALERIAKGSLTRTVLPWIADTLASKGAQAVFVADLDSQLSAGAALATLRWPLLSGLRIARVIANFAPPGVHVAGTLSYSTADQAQSAAEGAQTLATWVRRLGPLLGGVELLNLDVGTQASDVRCAFAIDDHTLRTLVALAPRLLSSVSP